MTTDPLLMFAKRMDKRASHLLSTVDKMVPAAFKAVADQVFLNSPVWSSQSVINWTASIGRTPKVGYVPVPGGGDTEGNMQNLTASADAEMARFDAGLKAHDVADTYKRPRRRSKAKKSIWLSNVVSYTPDLWTGTWPSNGMSLEETIQAGVISIKTFNVWRF